MSEYQFDDPILTPKEVAIYLKISPAKVYAWMKSGKMPSLTIGRNKRIRYSDLLEWLDSLVEKKVDDGSLFN